MVLGYKTGRCHYYTQRDIKFSCQYIDVMQPFHAFYRLMKNNAQCWVNPVPGCNNKMPRECLP